MKDTPESKRYHKIKNRLFYFGILLDAAFLIFFQVSGFSVSLREFASRYFTNSLGINAIYVTVFFSILHIIHFPIQYFLEFVWEHRFGLSTQNFAKWFIDDVKKACLSFIFVFVIVEVIYELLGRFSNTWWIGAGITWLFLSLFVARIMPHIIIPLFFKYSKVEDKDLREGIVRIFDKCKIALQEVYSINLSSKTKKANALVCGLGKSRRVVLTDNLIKNFSNKEIEAVLAHELGHYKHMDILKLTAVNAVVIFLSFFLVNHFLKIAISAFGLNGLNDIAGLPVFAFVMTVFGLLTAPILNAFSRFLEKKADIFSLNLTGNPDDFISMMKKLAEMNLAEIEPSWFNEIMFYDHPPILKRINLAQQFQKINA